MRNFVNNYMRVEVWLVLFIVFTIALAFVIYLVFAWMSNDKKNEQVKQQRQIILPNRTFLDVTIDPSGTLDDTFSSIRNQIGYIMSNLSMEGSLKVLITTSAFDGCITHHLVHILRELSRTTTKIDLLEDVKQMDLTSAVNSIKGHGIRIDNIYFMKDSMLISELADYDIIITAHSGIRSTYELIHGTVHELAMRER